MGSVSLGLCGKLMRFLFIVVQLLFFLIGLALIALGVFLVISHSDYEYLTGDKYISGAVVLIVAGGLSLIISGLGILGACTLSYFLLGLYTLAVIIVVGLQIAAGVVGFIFREDLETRVKDNALDAINDYRPEHNFNVTDYKEDANDVIDFIQDTTCEDSVLDKLKEYQLIVGAVGVAFGIIEIIGILMAIGLCISINLAKKKYTTV